MVGYSERESEVIKGRPEQEKKKKNTHQKKKKKKTSSTTQGNDTKELK